MRCTLGECRGPEGCIAELHRTAATVDTAVYIAAENTAAGGIGAEDTVEGLAAESTRQQSTHMIAADRMALAYTWEAGHRMLGEQEAESLAAADTSRRSNCSSASVERVDFRQLALTTFDTTVSIHRRGRVHR